MIAGSMTSCRRESIPGEDFPAIEIRYDENLVTQECLTGSSLQIRVPDDYRRIDPEALESVQAGIESDTLAYYPLKVLCVYTLDRAVSVLVSKIVSAGNISEFLDIPYHDQLVAAFQTDEIQSGQFRIRDLRVVQFMVKTDTHVVYKLICSLPDGLYQVDYLIQKSVYDREIRRIESSIASITHNKQTEEK